MWRFSLVPTQETTKNSHRRDSDDAGSGGSDQILHPRVPRLLSIGLFSSCERDQAAFQRSIRGLTTKTVT